MGKGKTGEKHRYKMEEKVYTFSGSIEHELRRTGKPPKGQRAKRQKATPEQIEKQNQYNREKNVRRLIKENFKPYDHWVTLTYIKGCRGGLKEALEDRKKFLRYLRTAYKKAGYELFWIGRTEVGKRGGLHHHMIINRIPDSDILISQAWQKIQRAGKVNFTPLREKGQFKDLAEYIVKPDKEDEMGKKVIQSAYSHSRNLKVPEPDIRRTTIKKIVTYPEPTPGYYIDKDSVCQGRNPVTGREYLHYIEIKINNSGG